MKDDQSSLADSVNRFQTTRWSVVLVSAQSQAHGYKEALADLCKLYQALIAAEGWVIP